MPRYFFDAANGSCHSDLEGAELASTAEARSYAIRYAGQSLSDDPALLAGEEDFRVEVRDSERLLLFTVTIFVTEAPAMMRA